MTGLLLGILLARTVAGFVAQWAGTLAGLVPDRCRTRGMRARGALDAVAQGEAARRTSLWCTHRFACTARQGRAAAAPACAVLRTWSGHVQRVLDEYTFLLTGPPYHCSESRIGLFGLVGAAGAMVASGAGRIADRGYASAATSTLALAMLGAWDFILAGSHSLAMLLIGVVILDIGAWGLQVTHQSVIYRLAPQAGG
jgi:hypothetical protein